MGWELGVIVYTFPGVRVRPIHVTGGQVTVAAEPTAASGRCPACQHPSHSRQSRSVRVVADLPACGRPVRVQLTVSRSYCRTASCPKQTFAEQILLVTRPHRQRLVRRETVLAAFSAAVGGEAGARLIRPIGVTVNGSSLRRVLRCADRAVPAVLGPSPRRPDLAQVA